MAVTKMTVKIPKFLHPKAFQNAPKLVFFGLKICHLATMLESGPIADNFTTEELLIRNGLK
jgi:hypothetical protein